MMNVLDFFNTPTSSLHKQYEALRAFFIDKKSILSNSPGNPPTI